jgi:DNA-binding winged helix-turn-helix (wHTH) protein/Tol biopolymer transport system component
VREIREFGVFRLDPGRRRLERTGGETVELGTKPFDALVFLVEHAGEPVSRKALIDALWPDTVVEENNLTQAVSALRRVLGEGYIVTLSGRGYQFVGEVRSAGRNSRGADAPGKSAAPPYIDCQTADRDWRQHSPGEQTDSAVNAHGPRSAGTLATPRVWVARHTGVRQREVAVTGKEIVSRPSWRRALPMAAALVVGLLVAGLSVWAFRPWPAAEPRPVNRLSYYLPKGQSLFSAYVPVMDLSRDGRRFVYNTTDGLYVRDMDRLEARPVSGTEGQFTTPVLSPDGQSVAYLAVPDELRRITLSGGNSNLVANVLGAPTGGASWGSDGTILYGQSTGIFRVSADGGQPELVVPAKEGERLSGPELLPDGDSLLFGTTTGSWDEGRIVVQSLSTGKRRVLVSGGRDAHYVPAGYLVYAFGDMLLAVAFDANRLTVSDKAVPVVRGVTRADASPTATAQYAVSDDGTLVYLRVPDAAPRGNRFFWVSHDGQPEDLGLEACYCFGASLSPDGKRVAVLSTAGSVSIWVWSRAQRTLTRLTFEAVSRGTALWSPDGTRIVYSSPKGLRWKRADGTGKAESLLDGGPGLVAWAWTANGELIFTDRSTGGVDIGSVAIEGDHTRRPLLATKFNEMRPALSPDGRWLAYESNESGQSEVYVRPFPKVDSGKWTVSSGGGEEPRWSRDGRTLYFLGPKSLMETTVDGGSGVFSFRSPSAVADRGDYFWANPRFQQYDVSPDGQRFLLMKPEAEQGGSLGGFVIVTNWTEELKRLVPRK